MSVFPSACSSRVLLPNLFSHLTTDGGLPPAYRATSTLFVRKKKEGITSGESSRIKERIYFRMRRLEHICGLERKMGLKMEETMEKNRGGTKD